MIRRSLDARSEEQSGHSPIDVDGSEGGHWVGCWSPVLAQGEAPEGG